MFEGFGVGLTVAQSLPAAARPPLLAGQRPARLSDVLPPETRTDAELAVELERVQQLRSRLAGYEVGLVAELAARRPITDDPAPNTPGAASPGWAADPLPSEVSEFFPDELALIVNVSRTEASKLLAVVLDLRHRLTATWAALADGELDWPRARAIAQELGVEKAGQTAPDVVRAVEALVLPQAMELSVSGVRAAVQRELQRLDQQAADRRREQAKKTANVEHRALRDGMARLEVTGTAEQVAAMHATADQLARAAKADGHDRPIGVLRVAALHALITRPWDDTRPPVTAHITVLAPLPALQAACEGGSVGAVDGQPITAAHLRQVLEQLDALCPGGLQAPHGGSLDIGLVDPGTGQLRATLSRSQLERLARRGCRDHPDDATRGGGNCGCAVLGRPEPVDGYRPPIPTDRFVRTRDQHCRMPGCHHRAGWADLDHVIPHAAGGATACDNLCCLCRRHHRLKTHARGWRFTMTPDGALTVTTPSGVTRITRPPGPDWYPGPAPPLLTGQAPDAVPAAEPPPF
ncbi:DUF222 domain-containing protein [Blastococcus sp. SYSU D00820]